MSYLCNPQLSYPLKSQNTSGDSKVAIFKRIGQVILPELYAIDAGTVANCLKGQL